MMNQSRITLLKWLFDGVPAGWRLEIIPFVRHIWRVQKARCHSLALLNGMVVSSRVYIKNKYLLHPALLINYLGWSILLMQHLVRAQKIVPWLFCQVLSLIIHGVIRIWRLSTRYIDTYPINTKFLRGLFVNIKAMFKAIYLLLEVFLPFPLLRKLLLWNFLFILRRLIVHFLLLTVDIYGRERPRFYIADLWYSLS
jgi:hypothetical protein